MMCVEVRSTLKAILPLVLTSMAIPWLISWLTPGNASSPTLVNALLFSSSESEGNLKIASIYISAPILVVMWPSIVVYKLCGKLHDNGTFAYYRQTLSTARRALFRSIGWSIFGSSLGAVVGLLVVIVCADIVNDETAAKTLFERLMVADSVVTSTIRHGFVTTAIIATSNAAFALAITLWTRGIVAVVALFSTFIVTVSFQDLPIFDRISTLTPVHYFDGFLAPISDGYVVDDWQTGRLLCMMWIAIVTMLLLSASFRAPKLGEIG